jgi:copper(I)-binding protein
VNNSLRINNMFILGPAPGFTLPRGASAGVYLALANNGGPDRLLSISAPGSAASVQVPPGGISVGSQESLLLTGPAPRLLLTHLTRTLHGGQWVKLNMNFQNAGHVSLMVPVMPRSGYYGTYSPAPLFLHPKVKISPLGTPSPTPTPTPTS